MDTPERSKVGETPISKFEDSPIFNFINSLSPIQPVKSVHGVQTFHSLSYASISSVFSSPHVNPQKDLRFLIRQPFPDSSKFEISSNSVDESNLCPVISNATTLSTVCTVAQEKSNITCLLNEATVDPPEESSMQPSNYTQIQDECGSPEHNKKPPYGIKMDLELNTGHTSVEVAHFVPDGTERRKFLFATEIELEEKHQLEESEEELAACHWEKLLSDDADGLSIFDPPIESEAFKGQDEKWEDEDDKTLTSYTSRLVDVIDITQSTQPEVSDGTCLLNAPEDLTLDNNGEVAEQHGVDHTPQMLPGTCQNQALLNDETQGIGNGNSICAPSDCKVDSQHQRGMRRRCLIFEVSGAPGKKSNNNSTRCPSVPSSSSSGKFASADRHLISTMTGSSLSPQVLPGIGLHLNTLATISKDRMVTPETPSFGRRVISMPCTISPFPPLIASKSLDIEKDKRPAGIDVPDPDSVHDVSCETPTVGGGEDLNHSPKKRKRKSDNGGESEACKRCNCKKSKCLKLYCECFAAGVYCVEPCSCQGCFNKPVHEETVLATRKQIESRNPLAFAPKVIRASEPVQDPGEENNKTPASARHKRGCNCKKSSCLKKYCECYQGGVGCSPSCRCEGCKNAFGRKDAAEEIEPGDEERDDNEKQMEIPDEDTQNAVAQNNEQPLAENILPRTPCFQICSSSVKLPLHSSGKPPRSSTLSIAHQTSQMLRRCDIPLHPCKTEKHIRAASDEDTPEILRDDASPGTGFKTSSPNGKRVSPPHIGLGISPNGRGRKLILKSIPSFPSLDCAVSNNHTTNYSSSSFGSSH